jgi:hypothetical protein
MRKLSSTAIVDVPATASEGDRFSTTLRVGGANVETVEISFDIVVGD